MRRSRKKLASPAGRFSAKFKATVALEAMKEQQTLAELSERFEVSPVVPDEWEKINGSDPKKADSERVVSSDGYTLLEKYLNGLIQEMHSN